MRTSMWKKIVCLFLIFLMLPSLALADGNNTSSTDTGTPAALAGGTPPLGSFSGSSFDHINLYNGNLSFTIPLASLVGRGGLSASVVLSYNSKIWKVENDEAAGRYGIPVYDQSGSSGGYHIAPGWSFNAGHMIKRQPTRVDNLTDPHNPTVTTLTTFTFIAPDGTEHDFRDDLTNGKPLVSPFHNEVSLEGPSRGITFHSADGSSATFISKTPNLQNDLVVHDYYYRQPHPIDLPSGIVLLRNGTRLKIVAGNVTEEQDRNGNVVRYTYDGALLTQVTDSLNRIISIETHRSPFDPLALRITVDGIGGIPKVTEVKRAKLADGLLFSEAVNEVQSLDQLYPDLDTTGGVKKKPPTVIFNPALISEIALPDDTGDLEGSGHKWQFFYNEYGEISRVITPGEAVLEYSHDRTPVPPRLGEDKLGPEIFRRVKERRSYPNGLGSIYTLKTTYSDPADPASLSDGVIEKDYSVNPLTGVESLVSHTKHKFASTPIDNYGLNRDELKFTGYRPWKDGKEIETTILDENGNDLRVTTYTYEQREPITWIGSATVSSRQQPENDPQLKQVVNRLENGQTSRVEYEYDEFNNIIQEITFGYDNNKIRKVKRDYLKVNNGVNYRNDLSVHQRSLVTKEEIFGYINNSEISEAITEYEYDLYTGANHAALDEAAFNPLDLSHNTSYNSSFKLRGNITAITSGKNSDKIKIYSQYDTAGNAIKTIGPMADGTTNPLPNTAIISTEYDSSHFAFPISTTQMVNGQEFKLEREYDFSTGALLSSTGFNKDAGEATRYIYDDALNRVTQVIRPEGFGDTTYQYSEAGVFPATVTTSTDMDGRRISSTTSFDGLLRAIKTEQQQSSVVIEPTDTNGNSQPTYVGGLVISETLYDGLGRVIKANNPNVVGYTSKTDGYAITDYDFLSRIRSVETFDVQDHSTGKVLTEYQGQSVTVTDQTGKQRKSLTDALGRLITVFEPDENGSLTLNTDYQYNARGNLLFVHQGVQTRAFIYDSLGRLTSAHAPESGTTTYKYDAASNLIERKDALNRTTTYTYDALNRVQTKIYSDSTPDVSYFYDTTDGLADSLPVGVTLPDNFDAGVTKGRLIAVATATMTNQLATANFYSYDVGGRIETSFQLLDGQHYKSSAMYNKASLPIQWTYPSDSRMDLRYNEVGQVDRIRRNGENFAKDVGYSPAGALAQQTLGNGLVHSIEYNSRLQPTTIALGGENNSGGNSGGSGGDDGGPVTIKAANTPLLNSIALTNKFLLEYDYGLVTSNDPTASLDQTKNNGNIGRIKITPGSGLAPFQQDFQYDELNRLKQAQEYYSSAPQITAISPATAAQGDTTTIQISGIHLTDTQAITFTPSNGITISNISSTNNLITATLAVSPLTTIGTRSVTVTTPLGESNALNFSIDSLDDELSLTFNQLVPPEEIEHIDRGCNITGADNACPGGGLFVPPVQWMNSIYSYFLNSGGGSGFGYYGFAPLGVVAQVTSDAYVETISEDELSYHVIESKVADTAKFHLHIPANIPSANLRVLSTRDFVIPHGSAVNCYFFYPFENFTVNAKMEVLANGNNVYTKSLSATGKGSGTDWSIANGNITSQSMLDEETAEISLEPGDYDIDVKITFDIPAYAGANWLYRLEVAAPEMNLKKADSSKIIKMPFNGFSKPKTGLSPLNDKKAIELTKVDNKSDNKLPSGIERELNDRVSKGVNNKSVINGVNHLNNIAPSTSWSQTYEYDRYGNHKKNPTTGETVSVDDNNNRLNGAGYAYDAAGNLTQDPNGKHYIYDTENRMIEVRDSNNNDAIIARYTYDANGKRVKKEDLSSNTTVRFIYGGGGKLFAEYEGEPVPDVANPTKEYVYGPSGLLAIVKRNGSGNETVQYLTPDNLGSPRVITDGDSNVVSRRDFHPFGEEISTDLGGRTAIDGYASGNDIRQKFTGYERDQETGLDFAQSRYFNNNQAKWMSPDPLAVTKESFVNPQRWNLYVYVNNNPISYRDPNGAQGQGNGGDKVINVFLLLPEADRNQVDIRGKAKYRLAPDYASTAKAASEKGYQYNIYAGDSKLLDGSSVPNAGEPNNANLQKASINSALTIIVLHTSGPGGATEDDPHITTNLPLSDGARISADPSIGSQLFTNVPTVCIGGCDSQGAAPSIVFLVNNASLVTVNSGADGVTLIGTIEEALNAFAKAYIDTNGDTDAATKAANEILRRDAPATAGISPNQTEPNNNGDDIIKNPVNDFK